MTNLADDKPDDIDAALAAAESGGARSVLAHLFLAEYQRDPARGWDVAIARVLSRAARREPKQQPPVAAPESVQPTSEPMDAVYTGRQAAALHNLAQLVATWIKRDVDAQLAERS